MIGNSKYKHHTPLDHAVNDARAVKVALQARGVHVFYVEDCDIEECNAIMDAFVSFVGAKDAAFVFFAGHACEYRNANRLLMICKSGRPDVRKDSVNVLVLLARFVTCSLHLGFRRLQHH